MTREQLIDKCVWTAAIKMGIAPAPKLLRDLMNPKQRRYAWHFRDQVCREFNVHLWSE